MSVTEIQHLRAEVARLEAELATKTGPPPSDWMCDGVGILDRSIEILSAIVDGHPLTIPIRLREIGASTGDPAEAGMFYMGQIASQLIRAALAHGRGHGVECDLEVIDLVRQYAAGTAEMRAQLGAPKAGG